jgi:hypothetical protein
MDKKRIPANHAVSCAAAALLWLMSWGASTPSMAAEDTSTPGDADLAGTACAIGLEKFLPADYYYCVAGQRYGLHDYGQAQRFFHEAAAWASKPADYVLGTMALDGDHQPTNRPLALAWYGLAAERHTDRFVKAYTTLRKHMSAEEIAQAGKLLQTLRPHYSDATAAHRAETRYHDGMRLLRQTANQSNYCIAGMHDFRNLAGASINPAQFALDCPSTTQVAAQIDQRAALVFEDWYGHTSVGNPQQVRPASESGGRHMPR